ncbi:hypothetical protein [Methylobacterium sp.]|jgi:hypothetical protein|uniref:hypothetical protein n=1 Tax=Methylobacterium sp. TaxID=409 RepID=UPI00261212B5|nr:hypothetical protein [Methylobacterium sp.]MDB5646150.1 hypothetical protein [Methylobacterium sp.]
MASCASVHRDLHVKIIIAVQSGLIHQSSIEHLLALKVAHEGEDRLSERERRYFYGMVEPILAEL